jgi:hypothetical protein
MFFAASHEDGVNDDAVNPSGESGVASERAQAAEDLNEGILHHVFGVRNIFRHKQTGGINAPPVQIENCGTRLRIAILGSGYKFGIGSYGSISSCCGRRANSGCAHWSILS